MDRISITGLENGEIRDPAAVRRVLKVLRLRVGDEFMAYDGRSELRLVVESVTRDGVRVAVLDERWLAPVAELTVAQCVIKGPRWDYFIEKMSELGVARILPVMSGRSVVRLDAADAAAHAERWRKIALSAAAQSAGAAPEVLEPVGFGAALDFLAPINLRVVICFAGGALPLWEALPDGCGGPAAILLGPEGDFTPGELDAAVSAGFVPAGLGTRILRSETAAVVASAFALRALTSRPR